MGLVRFMVRGGAVEGMGMGIVGQGGEGWGSVPVETAGFVE